MSDKMPNIQNTVHVDGEEVPVEVTQENDGYRITYTGANGFVTAQGKTQGAARFHFYQMYRKHSRNTKSFHDFSQGE